MKKFSLIVDGMLSGTGVRDAINGGYLDLEELGVSDLLRHRIHLWLSSYGNAHFHQYEDKQKNSTLDEEGMEIAKLIKKEFPAADVRYFSSANMQEIYLSSARS